MIRRSVVRSDDIPGFRLVPGAREVLPGRGTRYPNAHEILAHDIGSRDLAFLGLGLENDRVTGFDRAVPRRQNRVGPDEDSAAFPERRKPRRSPDRYRSEPFFSMAFQDDDRDHNPEDDPHDPHYDPYSTADYKFCSIRRMAFSPRSHISSAPGPVYFLCRGSLSVYEPISIDASIARLDFSYPARKQLT